MARAAEATGGAGLDVRARAELADHQAMGLGPEGAPLFERAAELYAEAGDPGEALAAHARAAYVRALAGAVDEAEAAVAEPYDRVLALFAEEGTGIPQTASVLMARARILMQRAYGVEEPPWDAGEDAAEGEGAEAEAPGAHRGRGRGRGGPRNRARPRAAPRRPGPFRRRARPAGTTPGRTGPTSRSPPCGRPARAHPVLATAETAVREVLALVDGHCGGDVQLASRAAEARAMLAELAVRAGDARTAAALFARAAGEYVAAGLPWFAVGYRPGTPCWPTAR
ncbi:Tetratricopeptide repeat protein OS=Streptomyces glaucescens OX=1907 GN=SGLAU_23985 PE=4 SV=1 [Streptomyces glaucescens]